MAIAQDVRVVRTPGDTADVRQVREFVRGFHVRSTVGGRLLFGERALSGQIDPGTALSLGVGYDVVDRERFVVSVGASFEQGLHRGPDTFDQERLGFAPASYTQGDVYLAGGTVTAEALTFVTRRLGVGGRVAAGAMTAPLLADREEYTSLYFPELGPGGVLPLHDAVLPTVEAGATLAYYTKLSHVAIVADAGVLMSFGLDPGVRISGGLEYTFGKPLTKEERAALGR